MFKSELMEEGTILAFVISSKRERYAGMLRNIKKRNRLRDELEHFGHFDRRFAKQLDGTADVAETLRLYGAVPDCWIISARKELDGIQLPLEDAIARVEASGCGALICCIAGRLAFYYGENGEQRLLLSRDR